MYVGGLEVEEVEEGRVVHGGRGPRRGDSRGIGGEVTTDIYCFLELNMLCIYCLLELNMLCDCVTRDCGDHSPLTTAAILEWRRRSAVW